jgi:predicted O-methyltransferase YrrM
MSTTAVSATSAHPERSGWLARTSHNLVRLPGRTVRSLQRLLDPSYRLERQARRTAHRWLSKEHRRALETIPGMASPHECRVLALLAHQAPDGGDIVEIGAWMGRSTAWLVEGATRRKHAPTVVSIDPHERDTWNTFNETIRRFDLAERGLVVHRARSDEIGRTWSRPISLLWVDGCHEYEAVRQDIADFTPHVMQGGWVVFDDAVGGVFPGVERAIAEQMAHHPCFQRVASIRHLAVFRRHS